MAINLSPVILATRFVMQIQAQEVEELSSQAKTEGIEHCIALREWVSRYPPDAHEGVNLISYLAITMRVKRLIERDECKQIKNLAKTIDVTTNEILSEKEHCPEVHPPYNVLSFERLIRWLSISNEEHFDYDPSIALIFSLTLCMLRDEIINEDKKNEMFQRLFQVIVKDPTRKVSNSSLADFLKQLGFKILRKPKHL
jgi:hypothetical protein